MEIQVKKPVSIADIGEIFVRNARSEDISEIYNIIKQEIPDDEFPPAEHSFKDAFETSPPWFQVLVAEKAGHIAGCALYFRSYWPRPAPPGRALRLRVLCVRRNVRRSGVGTKLFTELCRVALKENAQLNWSHPQSNQAAAAFFGKFKPGISDDLDGTYIMRIIPKTVREIAARRCYNTDVKVLPARQEDMAELSSMIREISEIRGTLDGPHLNEKDFVNDGFTSSPWFFTLIAWRAGAAVGTVIGHRVYNWSQSLDMQSLYVRPEARRSGLAKQLIVEFCRMAEEEGIEHVEFHVHPVNVESLALYASFGARRLTTFDDHVSFRLETDSIREILNQKF